MNVDEVFSHIAINLITNHSLMNIRLLTINLLMTIKSIITAVLLFVITGIDIDNSTTAKKYKSETIGRVNLKGDEINEC